MRAKSFSRSGARERPVDPKQRPRRHALDPRAHATLAPDERERDLTPGVQIGGARERGRKELLGRVEPKLARGRGAADEEADPLERRSDSIDALGRVERAADAARERVARL